jgi:hypothetical protein
MNWDFDTEKTRIKLTAANQAEGNIFKRVIGDGYDKVNITVELNHAQQITALYLWKDTKKGGKKKNAQVYSLRQKRQLPESGSD